jgi:hypothetical protein
MSNSDKFIKFIEGLLMVALPASLVLVPRMGLFGATPFVLFPVGLLLRKRYPYFARGILWGSVFALIFSLFISDLR